MKKTLFILMTTIFLFTLAACASQGGQTQTPADEKNKQAAPKETATEEQDISFFKDKTITFVNPNSPGGTTDLYSRLMSAFITKYLPGSTMIVKNVPGAGQIIGTNEIYEAKPDGLTIGSMTPGLMTGQLVKTEGVRYDFKKFTWLGNLASEPRVLFIGSKMPYKNIKEMMAYKDKIMLGSAGTKSSSFLDSNVLAKVLNFPKVEVVSGFPGSNDVTMAFLRGEIAGRVGSYQSISKDLLEKKEVLPFLIIGPKRLPELPDVPTIGEVAPPGNEALLSFELALAQLNRPVVAPPGMTPAMTKAWRTALEKTFNDPDLLAKAKQTNIPVEFMKGEDTAKAILAAMEQPPEVLKFLEEVSKSKK